MTAESIHDFVFPGYDFFSTIKKIDLVIVKHQRARFIALAAFLKQKTLLTNFLLSENEQDTRCEMVFWPITYSTQDNVVLSYVFCLMQLYEI